MVKGVGRNIYWMGAVSFFADIAGEMIAPLLPLYMTTVMGAPPTAVGLVEGALAGLMWTKLSPSAPFYFGAACAASAAVLLPFSVWRGGGSRGAAGRTP